MAVGTLRDCTMPEECPVRAKLDASDDPIAALKSAGESVLNAYWKDKDVAACKRIAKSAIAWGLEKADALGNANDKSEILGAVKPIAYNLSSFLWTGWDEPGIALAPSDHAIGEEAALLNLRLAVELQRDAVAQCRAHWLVGAFRLTAKDYAVARETFAHAARFAEDGNGHADAALNRAYAALAAAFENGRAQKSVAAYTSALDALAKVDDGADYVRQVRTAEKVVSQIYA